MPITLKAIRAAHCAAILFLAAPAFAETAEERAACTPDVMRLCASSIPNPDRITACLRRQQPMLSVACRTVMAPSDDYDVAATGSVRRRAAP